MILIIGIVLLLYLKTYRHYPVIDDTCERSDYLRNETDKVPVPEGFWNKRRPVWVTFQCISIFMLTCWGIYLNFGFWPALLFAVHPLNSSMGAWKIGSLIYGTSIFFCMVTWFFATGEWGVWVALPFYWCALDCSLSAIPLAFILPIYTRNPYTLLLFIPLILFLSGKRFRGGLKRRYTMHDKINTQADWRRVITMIKVMAYYPTLFIWPRDGFFHDYGHYAHNYWLDRLFALCVAMNVAFMTFGLFVDPMIYYAYILSMGVYSQFLCLGMFVAPRYTYLGNVFLCVLTSKYFLTYYPQALPIIASLWGYHTWLIIPNYRSNEALFRWSWQKQPLTSENTNNLAVEYMNQGRYDLALQPLLWSLKYSPQDKLHNVYYNLCQCYGNVAQFNKALHCVAECRKTCPPERLKKLDEIETDCLNRLHTMEKHRKTLEKLGVI